MPQAFPAPAFVLRKTVFFVAAQQPQLGYLLHKTSKPTDMVGDASLKLAVLIDADNASARTAPLILSEIAKYGTAFVKRAYGDWTTPNLNGWKPGLLENSIQPIQQFAYTQGKNSTDAAMVIDAMDLLYSNRFDGFCLVSSDSDFTRLASRIRESGLVVYGFGEKKTPRPFITACDKFIYVENLGPATSISVPEMVSKPLIPADTRDSSTAKPAMSTSTESYKRVLKFLLEAVEETEDDDGWAGLASVGHLVTKRRPDFDPRSFGHAKLSGLIIDSGIFDVVRRNPGEGKAPVVYLRKKLVLESSKKRRLTNDHD